MGRVLVLNATYTPISVVPERRGITLTLSGKVEVVANTDRAVSSENLSVPIPSVVRLIYFVRIPFRRRAPLTKRGIFARDLGRCQYCGKPAENVDHILPRSKGGGHTWENVVACCRKCNTYKGDQLLSECSLKLLSAPGTPKEHIWIRAAAGRIPAEWTPYLRTAA